MLRIHFKTRKGQKPINPMLKWSIIIAVLVGAAVMGRFNQRPPQARMASASSRR